MNTVENLMKPRWKVIANYPRMVYQVGDIVSAYENGVAYIVAEDSYSMNDFPALFEKLEWWQERSDDELRLIKYAKTVAGNSVRTVLRFELWWNKIILDGGKVRQITQWIPATEQEYNAYINQKNKNHNTDENI